MFSQYINTHMLILYKLRHKLPIINVLSLNPSLFYYIQILILRNHHLIHFFFFNIIIIIKILLFLLLFLCLESCACQASRFSLDLAAHDAKNYGGRNIARSPRLDKNMSTYCVLGARAKQASCSSASWCSRHT